MSTTADLRLARFDFSDAAATAEDIGHVTTAGRSILSVLVDAVKLAAG